MAELYPLMYNRSNLSNLQVMVEDGRVVTHIGTRVWDIVIHGCRVTIGSIGGVATYEECRGRGYGTKTLLHTFDHLREAGACAVFISGGRGLYLRNQCVKVSRVFKATLSAEAFPSPAGSRYHVRAFNEEELDAFVAVHQREPLRYIRPRHEFATVAAVSTEHAKPFWTQTLFGVWSGGELAAYAAVRCVNDPNRTPAVREYAGSRCALVEAMPLVLAAAEASELDLPAQPDDFELVSLLRNRGVECEPEPMPGTWRILSFAGFMDAMRAWIEERLSDPDQPQLSWEGDGDHGTFALGNDPFDLTDAQMAGEVLLGGPGGPDPRLSDAPERLREALMRILPVPVPQSGLNGV